jgi:small-conductance mechanosensitive channel
MERMARRRIETVFGVIYQTDPDLAEKVPEIVAQIVKDVPAVEFDRCGMSAFGPSSLDF